jgi:hypothetical protein
MDQYVSPTRNRRANFLCKLGCIVRYFLIPMVADDAPPFGTAKYEVSLDAINDSLTA